MSKPKPSLAARQAAGGRTRGEPVIMTALQFRRHPGSGPAAARIAVDPDAARRAAAGECQGLRFHIGHAVRLQPSHGGFPPDWPAQRGPYGQAPGPQAPGPAEPPADSYPELAFAAWLDQAGSGHLLVAENGRVLWAAQAALRLLAPDRPLGLHDGCLVARHRGSQAELIKALAFVAHRGERAELLVRDEDARPAIYLQAKRSPGNGIAVQLKDLARASQALPDLRKLYGLTGSELDTVQRLLNGQSVGEIAGQLGKSVLTIRTHVKRCYAKMGIGTKEQLFSTLLKLIG